MDDVSSRHLAAFAAKSGESKDIGEGPPSDPSLRTVVVSPKILLRPACVDEL